MRHDRFMRLLGYMSVFEVDCTSARSPVHGPCGRPDSRSLSETRGALSSTGRQKRMSPRCSVGSPRGMTERMERAAPPDAQLARVAP